MLTTYHPINSYVGSSTAHAVANFCLKPLVTAFGNEIDIDGDPGMYSPSFIVTAEKSPSFIKKCFAAVAAVVFFPMTLLGLAARAISPHQKIYANWEASFYTTKSKKEDVVRLAEEALKMKPTSLSEKLDQMIRLARVVNENYTHRLHLADAPHYVAEIKKLLVETVGEPVRDPNDPRVLSCSARDEFKKNVSYEEIRLCKKFLYRLTYLEGARDMSSDDLPPFKLFYQAVRTTYYDQFSANHLAHDLRDKGKIRRMDLEMPGLTPETIAGVQEAFSQVHNPSDINFMHGTGAATVAAIATTDGHLKPGGQLRENAVFNGEHNQGTFGVSNWGISGCALENHDIVLNYAKGLGIGKHNSEETDFIRKNPLLAIKFYKEVFSQINPEEYHTSYVVNPTNLHNFHRNMRILYSLAPKEFKEEIIPAIEQLNASLSQSNNQHARAVRDEIFAPILAFKEPLHYDEADRELIQRNFPVIFAATEIKLVKDKSDLQEKNVAYYLGGTVKEYVFKGSLELGQDLPFVFVPQAEVERTRKYLLTKKVENIRVHSLETLKIATKFKEFVSRKKGAWIEYRQFFDRPIKS